MTWLELPPDSLFGVSNLPYGVFSAGDGPQPGPRVGVRVSTLAGECSEKLAAAASNSGLPGEGTTHRSYSASDSSPGSVFPKL